jgi:hypothetical protein
MPSDDLSALDDFGENPPPRPTEPTPPKPPDHVHSKARTLPFGVDMCACGAAFGIDQIWRT